MNGRTSRPFRIGLILTLAFCVAGSDVFRHIQVLQRISPRSASAATPRWTELGAARLPALPRVSGHALPSHLPIGFDDIQSFHRGLVLPGHGALQVSYQDLLIPIDGPPLAVRRTYNSHSTARSAFGHGWSWNLGVRVQVDPDTSRPYLIGPEGLRRDFVRVAGSDVYRPVDTRAGEQLELSETGALLLLPQGRRQHFDTEGRLRNEEDSRGRQLTLHYDGTTLIAAEDAAGRRLEFSWQDGRIAAVRDPLGRTWEYHYSGDLLQAVTDPMGRRTRFDYATSFVGLPRLVTVGFPNASEMRVSYQEGTHRVSSLDGPGRLRTRFHHRVNPPTASARTWTHHPAGGTTEFAVGPASEVAAGEDDSSGPSDTRLEWRTEDGDRTTLESHGSGVTLTDPAGGELVYRTDDQGRLAYFRDQVGDEITVDADPESERIESVTFPGQRSVQFDYENGTISSIRGAAGEVTRIQADSTDRSMVITDPAGVVRGAQMNEYGYPVGITGPGGEEIALRYDVVGRITEVVDPATGAWRYGYDDADNLVSVVSPTGDRMEFEYDELDNMTVMRDAGGLETVYRYDPCGLLLEVVYPDGLRDHYEYDDAGSLTAAHVARQGRPLQFEMDAAGRITGVVDSNGSAYRYDYGPTGLLERLETPNGGDTDFRYDAAGRLVARIGADGDQARVEYSAAGTTRRVVFNSERGAPVELVMEHDQSGRPVAVAGGSERYELQYDASGRLIRATAPGSESILERDDQGRVVSYHDAALTSVPPLHFDFTPAGLLGVLRLGDQDVRRFEYRADGSWRSLAVDGFGTLRFEQDGHGQVSVVRYPGGLELELQRDAGDRLSGMFFRDASSNDIVSWAYEYDESGRIHAIEAAGTDRWEYGYDEASRLLSVQHGDGTLVESYTYDANGNLTSILPFGSADLQYDAADKLLPQEDLQLEYDSRGNVTGSRGDARFRYDAMGQLVEGRRGDRAVAYTYDAFGRRTTRRIGDSVTAYTYDAAGHLLAEYDASGRMLARYVYGPGIDFPLAMYRDGEWFLFATDHLGTVRALLDRQGRVVEAYEFTAYGQPLEDGRPVDRISERHPFGFAGRVYEPELGIYHVRNRVYDPLLGRFLQRDPSGAVVSPNLYAYADQNPISLRDPWGTDGEPGNHDSNHHEGEEHHGRSAVPAGHGDGHPGSGHGGGHVSHWPHYTEKVTKVGWIAGETIRHHQLAHRAAQAAARAARAQQAYTSFLGAVGPMSSRARPAFDFTRGIWGQHGVLRGYSGLTARRSIRAQHALQRFGTFAKAVNLLWYAKFYYDAFQFFTNPNPTLGDLLNLEISAGLLIAGFGLAFGLGPLGIAIAIGVGIAALIIGLVLLWGWWNDDPTFVQPPPGTREEPVPTSRSERETARDPVAPIVEVGITRCMEPRPPDSLEGRSTAPAPAPFADVRPYWITSEVPPGAAPIGVWEWHDSPGYRGARSHSSGDTPLHYFIRAEAPLAVGNEDNLIQYVYLDPDQPPDQILLQLYTEEGNGEHRVYWGENSIDLGGEPGTGSLFFAGPVPESGRWVRLRVPIRDFGLGSAELTGLLFGQYGGQVYWGPTTRSEERLDNAPAQALVAPETRGSASHNVRVDVRFRLTAAGLVSVVVHDESNEPVAVIHDGWMPDGSKRLEWDGRTEAGDPAPDGDYRLRFHWQPADGTGSPQPDSVDVSASFVLSRITAELLTPGNGSLVQGTVPVFGTADALDFDRYVLDYGAGVAPEQWTSIAEWTEPESIDEPSLTPFSRRTIYGNLGSFSADSLPRGPITIRLRVWDRSGRQATVQRRVYVADVAKNAGSTRVTSSDGNAWLTIPAMSLRRPFHLFCVSEVVGVQAEELVQAARSAGAEVLGSCYRVRPAGFRFERAVTVSLRESTGTGAESDVSPTGLYVFDPGIGGWRRLDDQVRREDGEHGAVYEARIGELPADRAVIAILAERTTSAGVALSTVRPDEDRQTASVDSGRRSTPPRPYISVPGEAPPWYRPQPEDSTAGPWDGRAGRHLLWSESIDLTRHPILSFRYCIPPEQTLHLQVQAGNTWYGFSLAGEPFTISASHGEERVLPGGNLPVVADGTWHTAHVNLREVLAALVDDPPDADSVQVGVAGHWMDTGYNEVTRAPQPVGSARPELRDVLFHAAGTQRTVLPVVVEVPPGASTLVWLDRHSDSEEPLEPLHGTQLEIPLPASDGIYYLHAKAVDESGHESETLHLPIVVDRTPPVVTRLSPSPGATTADVAVSVQLSDGSEGSGIDAHSVRLHLNGTTYGLDSPAVEYDASTRTLSFYPWQAEPALPAWTDGQRIEVSLLSLSDLAGNAATELPEWNFTVASTRDGTTQARMISPDGGMEPAWSPESDRVVYVLPGDPPRLAILHIEADERQVLDIDLDSPASPDWSPDGDAVVVSARGTDGSRDLFLVDVGDEGPSVRTLTAGRHDDSDPAWFSDGSRIVFARDGELWEVDVATGVAMLIHRDPDSATLYGPRVSRDGRTILYGRRLYDESVYRLDLVSGETAAVTADGLQRDPAWGRDPDSVIYVAALDGFTRLEQTWIARPQGTPMAPSGAWFDASPRVSPDGNRMVFQSTRNGFWNLWLIEWRSLAALHVVPDRYEYEAADGAPGADDPGIRIAYDLGSFSAGRIIVTDPSGEHLFERDVPPDSGEHGEVRWDARDSRGERLEAGAYRVQLIAQTSGGEEPALRGHPLTILDTSATAGALESPAAPTPERSAGEAVVSATVPDTGSDDDVSMRSRPNRWWILLVLLVLAVIAFGFRRRLRAKSTVEARNVHHAGRNK